MYKVVLVDVATKSYIVTGSYSITPDPESLEKACNNLAAGGYKVVATQVMASERDGEISLVTRVAVIAERED